MQGKSVQEIIEYRERTLGEFITSLVDPKERGEWTDVSIGVANTLNQVDPNVDRYVGDCRLFSEIVLESLDMIGQLGFGTPIIKVLYGECKAIIMSFGDVLSHEGGVDKYPVVIRHSIATTPRINDSSIISSVHRPLTDNIVSIPDEGISGNILKDAIEVFTEAAMFYTGSYYTREGMVDGYTKIGYIDEGGIREIDISLSYASEYTRLAN